MTPRSGPAIASALPSLRLHVARGARLLCLALMVVPALWSFAPYLRENQVRQAAQPHEFNLPLWEIQQLSQRLPGVLAQLAHPPPAEAPLIRDDDVAAVRTFFTAAAAYQEARARRADEAELSPLRASWQAAQSPAQAAIGHTLAVLARQESLIADTPFGEWLLPPASFVWSEPPRVLVVSPRDRIEVQQSVLLRPDLPLAEAQALETEAERLGLSALVVEIGGIATYPTIVPLQRSPVESLSAVAHEWLHGYLIFHPLGRAYFGSYDGRSVNETVADLAGRELGRALARAYGLESPPTAERGNPAPDPAGFDFRAELRATRLRLDQLLASGEVEAAERYLEERRLDFVSAGYPIRRLNQAYFAFHGSYAESAAAVSPLDEQVRRLRAQSGGLGTFLRRVAQMTTSAEVAAAAAAAGEGS
jgi:hypothetical protein